MYFIVNKENFVIAASEKFLQRIGARDICLISSMYKDGSIVIDEESKSIKILTKELNLDYEKSKLYSSFGELTHFRLYDKEEKILEIEENDDISYLKKIKKGVIEKEDNEFDIPKIAALLEEPKEDKEDKKEAADDETPQIVSEIESIKILDQESEETKDNKQEAIENKEELAKDEKIEDFNNEISLQIEEKEEKIEDELAALKSVVTQEDIENIETSQDNEVEIPPIPIEKIREKQKRKEQSQSNEESVEIKEKLVKIEDTKPEIEESNDDKKSIFSFRKKDQSSQEIETIKFDEEKELEELKAIEPLKDESSNIQTEDLKPLQDEAKSEELDNLIQELETIELKEKIKKEESVKEEVKSDTEVNDEEIILKTKPALEATKKDNDIVAKIAKVQVESLDLEDNAKRLNLDLDSYKMLLNSYINEFARVDDLLKKGDKKSIDMLIDAGQLLALDSVVLKLTKLKNANDPKDIEQKANEIEIYIKELKNKIDENKNEEDLKALSREEIKEELTKDITFETEIEKKVEEEKSAEEILNRDEKALTIEEDYLEEDIFSSDKTLLKSVKKKDVFLEIEETAMELNIPKDLVLEFTKDFLIQAKEHLPILIDEYKRGNVIELQQTAHMLKGAANNLRLNSIADVLFRIQKSSDLEYDKELIIKFASLVKGLEEALKTVDVEIS